MNNAVTAQNLGKIFSAPHLPRFLAPLFSGDKNTTAALDSISFAVKAGEIFGLIGPNGAGKTTLLKIMSCLILPTTGTVSVAGFDISKNSCAVRNAIGLVSGDERSFYWRLSGRQNLEFFGIFYNLSPGKARQRSQELIELLDIPEPDRMVSTYSSGMKQRLALARALLHDPPVLFMDEPTKSLDPSSVKKFHHFVTDYLSGHSRKTILWATHNLAEATRLCGRIAILKQGRIAACGALEDLRQKFALPPEATLEDIFTLADAAGGDPANV